MTRTLTCMCGVACLNFCKGVNGSVVHGVEGSCLCKSNGSSGVLYLKLLFWTSLVGGHSWVGVEGSCSCMSIGSSGALYLRLWFWPSLVGGHSCLHRRGSPLIEVDDTSHNTFFRAHIVICRALGEIDSSLNMELSSTLTFSTTPLSCSWLRSDWLWIRLGWDAITSRCDPQP